MFLPESGNQTHTLLSHKSILGALCCGSEGRGGTAAGGSNAYHEGAAQDDPRGKYNGYVTIPFVSRIYLSCGERLLFGREINIKNLLQTPHTCFLITSVLCLTVSFPRTLVSFSIDLSLCVCCSPYLIKTVYIFWQRPCPFCMEMFSCNVKLYFVSSFPNMPPRCDNLHRILRFGSRTAGRSCYCCCRIGPYAA